MAGWKVEEGKNVEEYDKSVGCSVSLLFF